MQDLRARMAAAEGRSAGSTSLTTSTDTPMLTMVALALAVVSRSLLLWNTLLLSLLNQSIHHVSNSLVPFHCHVLKLRVLHSTHLITTITTYGLWYCGHIQVLKPIAGTPL